MDRKRSRQIAREFFGRYISLQKEIESLDKQIEKLRSRVDVSSPIITGMPRGSSFYTLDDYIADVEELIIELQKTRQSAILEFKNIERVIRLYKDPLQRTILRGKYLFGIGLGDMAAKLNYSETRIYHVHQEALDQFEKLTSFDK